ncbi:MAG TPA: penicillin acylase family protein [Pirellulales bacterium]|nr:penicillin acylase family protein [Pirellulales bacterium]
MKLSGTEILKRLGAGEPIAQVAAAAGIERDEFDRWWKAEIAGRVPAADGKKRATVGAAVEITRDQWGIPHIKAQSDDDLFFGFGYAMAQDRLFQLDYLRRRAWGRLSEVFGPETFELDLLARTIGLARIAAGEWNKASGELRGLLNAFTAGVNALIADTTDRPPIEFDLLDYRPEPWSPVDCLAIEGEFRWYLTGRFPVIVVPELIRGELGEGFKQRAFLLAEADDESILPRGSYTPGPVNAPTSGSCGDANSGEGSNNWVVSGARTASGKPLLASDPHIAFAAVSCWYEVHLCGGSFNVAGMAYAGMPAVMFGRNERIAWGCTNNICSQRDLYLEQTDPRFPGCFRYDGRWEPAEERKEIIKVKDEPAVRKTIRSSRNGPIVDKLLPGPTKEEGPVSLRWLGSERCGWLEALVAMDRARSADEFREATRPWMVPTFSVVFCDSEGHIGYQCTGRIPLRKQTERGYRRGWDPEHQWQGMVPFEGMPRLADPARGFVVTANNRTAPDDFPYRLAGTWSSGHRARRIRQMIEAGGKLTRDDMVAMQHDALSLRARECVPRLIELFAGETDRQIRQAVELLRHWDGRMETDQVAAAIFDMFFVHWCWVVARGDLTRDLADFVSGGVGGLGLAAELLSDSPLRWFPIEQPVRQAFVLALATLTARFGPNMSNWTWGRLHHLQQPHVLSRRGELGTLLDHARVPVKGDMLTVCNTGNDAGFQATTGAGYRMIVDMSIAPPELWAVDAGSQSGHPGSPHYADQLADWLAARYHRVPLVWSEVEAIAKSRLVLEPNVE